MSLKTELVKSLYPTLGKEIRRCIIVEYGELANVAEKAEEIRNYVWQFKNDNNGHICKNRGDCSHALWINMCGNEKIGICKDHISLYMVYTAKIHEPHSIDYWINLLPEDTISNVWLLMNNGNDEMGILDYQFDDVGSKKEIKKIFKKVNTGY